LSESRLQDVQLAEQIVHLGVDRGQVLGQGSIRFGMAIPRSPI
jgi:hypothetical protein